MKKILIPIHILVWTGTIYAQSSPSAAENYIQTKEYLEPVNTSSSTAKQINTVQYFNRLGNLKQVVNVKGSPKGRDIVQHVEYDNSGRQIKDFLPVPQNATQNGAIYSNSLTNALDPDIYGNEKIYSERILENSSFNKVKQQKQIGNSWEGKFVQFDYDVNVWEDYVRKYETTTVWDDANKIYKSSVKLLQYFQANVLYKSIVTDEDGNQSIEFKNSKGQIILMRKVLSPTKNADTYYVYDDYDQLVYIIPPLASAPTVEPVTVEKLYYEFKYDSKGRIVEKKVPGKGWEYLIYDKQDRIVLTQDASLGTLENNFKKKGWLFTKYDQFNRIVYTGFFANTATRTSMQTAINNMSANPGNNEVRSTTPFTLNGMDVFYTKSAFPTGSMTILSINYYDSYQAYSFNPVFPANILGAITLTDNSVDNIVSTKNLPVMNFIKNIEDDNWTKNYTYYDNKTRVIGTYSINHLGGYTKVDNQLDFVGIPLKTNTEHLKQANESVVSIKETFEYDGQNRPTKHLHQVDSQPVELLTENSYNELSQIKTKKVGNNLQSIDYTYNVRGWMTDINKDQMSLPDLGGKLFSYKIKYTQKEGITNPDPSLFLGKDVKPKFNGNITEIDWRSITTLGENPPVNPKRYGYVYDNLNRLTAAYYQNPNNPNSKENTESLTYDTNGNILNLFRTSVVENNNNTASVIDNLEYDYSGNQVTKIKDNSTNPTGYEGGEGTIKYDLNGNMSEMPDKKITSIKYNFLNLPNKLAFLANDVMGSSYLYRSDGVKLQKISQRIECGFASCYSVSEISDYLGGFQYQRIPIINNGGGSEELRSLSVETNKAMEIQAFTDEEQKVIPPLGTSGLSFFPTSEGYYDYAKKQYIYQYKDHLGNNRVSYKKNSMGVIEITDSNDYYPYGMNHLNSGNAFFSKGSYKNYKYNGKELQETGMYAMDFRQYMPEIGRFVATDALSEVMPNWSPYRFAFGNPVYFSDPTGLFEKELLFKATLSNIIGFPDRPGTEKGEVHEDGDGRFIWDGAMWRDSNGNGISYVETKIDEINLTRPRPTNNVSWIWYAGHNLASDSHVRINYYYPNNRLIFNNYTSPAEYAFYRYHLQQSTRAQLSTQGKALSQILKTKQAQLSTAKFYAATNTRPSGNIRGGLGAAKIMRGAGTAVVVVAAGMSVYNVATAENKAQALSSEVGGWAGAWAGAEYGAMMGSFAGPWGTVIGGVIGGAVGYYYGADLGESLYNNLSE